MVPPPPAVQGAASSAGSGRLIALGIHPAVAPPAEPPQGNRRGTFAASPEGKAGAAGTPDIKGDSSASTNGHGNSNSTGRGNGTGNGVSNGAPPGIHVGAPAQPPTSAIGGSSGVSSAGGAGSSNGTMTASASPEPKISAAPASVSASVAGQKWMSSTIPARLNRKYSMAAVSTR